MSLPSALLQTQTSKLFFQFYLSTPLPLSPPHIPLTFSRKNPTFSTNTLRSSPSHYQPPFNPNYDDDAEEEEEHVIGDCVVFEEGIFEDPYLQQTFDSPPNFLKQNKTSNRKVEVEAEDLVPEKWKKVQAEINVTKKEKRAMKREMEFGRRVERMRQGLVPIGSDGARVRVEEYREARTEKSVVNDGDERKRSERVAPRNPRLGVYGGTLDDITDFFSSGSYDPESTQNNEGRRMLFTKEEKILLNRRIPELSAATSDKWQPLHSLAASGEFYLVNALLKHNVDINIKDKDGLTVLHKAVISKKQAIVNYLLRESANPFIRDQDGATLMHYAVRTASSSMIKVLLLYNVDINLQDNDGWTPLHLAVQTRRTDIVRLLLIKGADKTVKANDGLTPLDLCLYSGQDARTYELIKLMKQLPKPRYLV